MGYRMSFSGASRKTGEIDPPRPDNFDGGAIEIIADKLGLVIHAEQDLATAHIPDNTVAVVEFNSTELPPDLASDLIDRGIILTGGGALLTGLDQIIRERTKVPVNVAENAILSVVQGTGIVLENLDKYEAVLM